MSINSQEATDFFNEDLYEKNKSKTDNNNAEKIMQKKKSQIQPELLSI